MSLSSLTNPLASLSNQMIGLLCPNAQKRPKLKTATDAVVVQVRKEALATSPSTVTATGPITFYRQTDDRNVLKQITGDEAEALKKQYPTLTPETASSAQRSMCFTSGREVLILKLSKPQAEKATTVVAVQQGTLSPQQVEGQLQANISLPQTTAEKPTVVAPVKQGEPSPQQVEKQAHITHQVFQITVEKPAIEKPVDAAPVKQGEPSPQRAEGQPQMQFLQVPVATEKQTVVIAQPEKPAPQPLKEQLQLIMKPIRELPSESLSIQTQFSQMRDVVPAKESDSEEETAEVLVLIPHGSDLETTVEASSESSSDEDAEVTKVRARRRYTGRELDQLDELSDEEKGQLGEVVLREFYESGDRVRGRTRFSYERRIG